MLILICKFASFSIYYIIKAFLFSVFGFIVITLLYIKIGSIQANLRCVNPKKIENFFYSAILNDNSIIDPFNIDGVILQSLINEISTLFLICLCRKRTFEIVLLNPK